MTYSKEQLVNLVVSYAAQYGINSAIALAQIKRESADFRSDVVYGPFVGSAGERGMAQFTPGTWTRFGAGAHSNAYDPDASLDAWGRYMTYLLSLFGGDYSLVLQAYNGGEGHVQRGSVSSAAKNYARAILAEAEAEAASLTPAENFPLLPARHRPAAKQQVAKGHG